MLVVLALTAGPQYRVVFTPADQDGVFELQGAAAAYRDMNPDVKVRLWAAEDVDAVADLLTSEVIDFFDEEGAFGIAETFDGYANSAEFLPSRLELLAEFADNVILDYPDTNPELEGQLDLYELGDALSD